MLTGGRTHCCCASRLQPSPAPLEGGKDASDPLGPQHPSMVEGGASPHALPMSALALDEYGPAGDAASWHSCDSPAKTASRHAFNSMEPTVDLQQVRLHAGQGLLATAGRGPAARLGRVSPPRCHPPTPRVHAPAACRPC